MQHMTDAANQPTDRPATSLAERAARARASAPSRKWVSRFAVLGTLGVLTIAGPLTGATASSTAVVDAASVTAQDGVVKDLATGSVELDEATDLTADPYAATRVVATASRDYARQALTCAVQSEANGTLSAAMGGENVAPDLVMPMAEGTYRLTSHYGYRTYPYRGMHEGTDFAAPVGTPLYAVADGTIIYAGGGKDGRSGQIVILRAEVNGTTYDFWYGHMYTNGVHVSVGQEVSVGQKIAAVGNNGNSTGPHVHFEVHNMADETINPYSFLTSNNAQPTSAAAACA